MKKRSLSLLFFIFPIYSRQASLFIRTVVHTRRELGLVLEMTAAAADSLMVGQFVISSVEISAQFAGERGFVATVGHF